MKGFEIQIPLIYGFLSKYLNMTGLILNMQMTTLLVINFKRKNYFDLTNNIKDQVKPKFIEQHFLSKIVLLIV